MTTYDSAGVSQKLGDDASKVLYEAAKLTWENRKGKLGEIVELFSYKLQLTQSRMSAFI